MDFIERVSLSLVIVIITINKSKAQVQCVLDNRLPEDRWEQKILGDIEIKYDLSNPPGNCDAVKARLVFDIISFGFLDGEEVFYVSTRILVFWEDKRLTWDPKQYHGIKEIVLSSKLRIWKPYLEVVNGDEAIDYDSYDKDCILDFTGFLYCLENKYYQVLCGSKLSQWPFDIQQCRFDFGALKNSKKTKVKFIMSNKNFFYNITQYSGSSWLLNNVELSNKTIKTPTYESDIQFSVSITVQRCAVSYFALIVLPSIMSSTLTLTALFLEVKTNVRFGLLCFSLLNHFTVLKVISTLIPQYSANTPVILLYVRESTLITLLAIILTLYMGYLRKKATSPPYFINRFMDYIVESRLSCLLYPRWETNFDNVTISEDFYIKKAAEEWTLLTNLINTTAIVVVLVIFIGMLMTYLPSSVS